MQTLRQRPDPTPASRRTGPLAALAALAAVAAIAAFAALAGLTALSALLAFEPVNTAASGPVDGHVNNLKAAT